MVIVPASSFETSSSVTSAASFTSPGRSAKVAEFAAPATPARTSAPTAASGKTARHLLCRVERLMFMLHLLWLRLDRREACPSLLTPR
jgi:hypothetical protein